MRRKRRLEASPAPCRALTHCSCRPCSGHRRDTGPGTGPLGSGDRVQLGRSPGRPWGSVGYGPQPVVERPAPQGQALAHHAEAAAVVQSDGGVESAPAVELQRGAGARRCRGRATLRGDRRRPPRPSGGLAASATPWTRGRPARSPRGSQSRASRRLRRRRWSSGGTSGSTAEGRCRGSRARRCLRPAGRLGLGER